MAEPTAVVNKKFSWGDFAKIAAGFLVVGVGFSQDKEQLVSAAIVTVTVWLFNVYMKKAGKKPGRGWLSGFVLVGSVALTWFNHPPDVVIPIFPTCVDAVANVTATVAKALSAAPACGDLIGNVTSIVNWLAAMVIGTGSTSVFAYATILYNSIVAKINDALGLK